MLNVLSRSRHSLSLRQLCLRHPLELNLWNLVSCVHTVPRSGLGAMNFTTSARRAGTRGRPHISSHYRLLTLRPEQMLIAGQQMIDLSGKILPSVPTLLTTTKAPMLCPYEFKVTKAHGVQYTPYPDNTKGVFYYHHPPGRPEVRASVRFRICDSVAEFEHGRDLLDSRGDVWGPTLLELVKHKVTEGFLPLLHADRLVDEALIEDIHKLGTTSNVRRYQYLLSDPFYLNVAQHKISMTYVTRAKMVRLSFPQRLFVDQTGNRIRQPLTGTIKCQFELSDLREHKKWGPTLVIRVLDVVKPIVVDPLYDGNVIPVPVPGTLLYRLRYGKEYVARIPLKRQRMADDLLELMKISWA